jgi:integrase/recombinase XerC
MASIRFLKKRNRWEVRKHYTDRETGEVSNLHKMTRSRRDAYLAAAEFDQWAELAKEGKTKTFDTVAESVEKWLIRIGCCTPRTLDLYKRAINKFIAGMPPEINQIDKIKPQHVNDYIENILEDRTARTANSRLTVVKSFCRWFSRTYDLLNPAAKVDFLREEPPEHRFLSPDEYQKILSVSDDDTADIFRLLANTGCRASEFCNLKWCDIDIEQTAIAVLGKGRKLRTIPMNQTVLAILQSLPHTSEYIFPSQNPKFPGISINRRTLYDFCIRAAKKAAIPAFGPHALRHFFATELLKAGAPIVKVSLIMGHANTTITLKVYAHIMPGDLKGATDILCENSKTQFKGETKNENEGKDSTVISIARYQRQNCVKTL